MIIQAHKTQIQRKVHSAYNYKRSYKRNFNVRQLIY